MGRLSLGTGRTSIFAPHIDKGNSHSYVYKVKHQARMDLVFDLPVNTVNGAPNHIFDDFLPAPIAESDSGCRLKLRPA